MPPHFRPYLASSGSSQGWALPRCNSHRKSRRYHFTVISKIPNFWSESILSCIFLLCGYVCRAIRVLRSADVILSEDTRHSGKLLQYYNIKAQLVSFLSFFMQSLLHRFSLSCDVLNLWGLGFFSSVITSSTRRRESRLCWIDWNKERLWHLSAMQGHQGSVILVLNLWVLKKNFIF